MLGVEIWFGASLRRKSGASQRARPVRILEVVLELEAHYQLHDSGIACAVNGAESIDVVQSAIRFQVEVGDGWVSKSREVQGAIDAAELSVVEHVEGIGAELELIALLHHELLLDRQIRG